jgi:hypothetical protein
MSKLPLIAAAFLAIPAPALAQIVFVDTPPLAPPTKQDKSKSDWDKIQCRAQDETGSRLRREPVCLTKWQWWSAEQETKEWIQSMERLGSSSH